MLSLKGTSVCGVGVGTTGTGGGVTVCHCVQRGADLGLRRNILPLAIVAAPCCLPSLLSFLPSGLSISYTPRVPTRVGSDQAAHLLPGGLFFSSCFSTEGRSETV